MRNIEAWNKQRNNIQLKKEYLSQKPFDLATKKSRLNHE